MLGEPDLKPLPHGWKRFKEASLFAGIVSSVPCIILTGVFYPSVAMTKNWFALLTLFPGLPLFLMLINYLTLGSRLVYCNSCSQTRDAYDVERCEEISKQPRCGTCYHPIK